MSPLILSFFSFLFSFFSCTVIFIFHFYLLNLLKKYEITIVTDSKFFRDQLQFQTAFFHVIFRCHFTHPFTLFICTKTLMLCLVIFSIAHHSDPFNIVELLTVLLQHVLENFINFKTLCCYNIFFFFAFTYINSFYCLFCYCLVTTQCS